MSAAVKLNDDYLKAEAVKLNKELENLLAEARSRERYSLAIIAGIATWLFTNLDKLGPQLSLWLAYIPLATTAIYGGTVLMLYRNILWIGDYLQQIEDHFLPQNPKIFGWENYFDERNKYHLYVGFTILFWLLQVSMAVFLFCKVNNYDFAKAGKDKVPVSCQVCCKTCH